MKAENESWWLSHVRFFEKFVFYTFLLLLPTQLGKHFWFGFSFVLGQRIDYLSPTLYVTDILLVLLFITVVLQKIKIVLRPLFLFFLLFVGISIFLSASPFAGWYFFTKLLEISFVVWYVIHARFSYRVAGILIVISVVFESILSIFQLALQHSIGGVFYFFGERAFSATTPGIANASIRGMLVLRPYGTFPHPNMLAGYLAVALFLILYFFWNEKKIQKTLPLFLSLVFGVTGILISLSRTAIVTEIIVWTTILFVAKKATKQTILILFFAVICILLLDFFDPEVVLRFLALPNESLAQRIILAVYAVRMVLMHPVFGVGPNNFISTLPGISPNGVILQPVHSMYLLILAELGIGGFLFFCYFLLKIGQMFLTVWKKTKDNKQKLSMLCAAFLVILFIGFLDHYFFTLQQGQLLFGVTVGLLLREQKAIMVQYNHGKS